MKKLNYLIPLFCLLLFANCRLFLRTSVKVEGEITKIAINTKGQPITIVYTSTDLTKEFMISFKNHLLDELKKKGIKAQLETAKDKLPSSLYLNLLVINENRRRTGHLLGAVYEFNGATIDVELKNTEGGVLGANRVTVNHVYKSDLTAAASKAAQKLAQQLHLTN
jgi:hypothetical protein